MKISIVGAGYVGMSLAILLAQNHDITILDTNEKKVERLKKGILPISDIGMEKFFNEKQISLVATTNKLDAYKNASCIIFATPTDFNDQSNEFDTSILNNVINDAIECNSNALLVIKSTVPVGFTKNIRKKFKTDRILFSPEFLREGKALDDNLLPSRIIVSNESKDSKLFGDLLLSIAINNPDIMYMNSNEAEAVKLFSNSYLAMRVAFFNELDSFALDKNLNTKNIIDGVCLDSRIGDHYNNPSFGYGGYCLPKDTKQLLNTFSSTPQTLISSIVSSNNVRKDFLANFIKNLNPKVVGIFRMAMKSDSDNIRDSAVISIINNLSDSGIRVLIYEPLIQGEFMGHEIIESIEMLKTESDIIIANRKSNLLDEVKHKVFSRDIYLSN